MTREDTRDLLDNKKIAKDVFMSILHPVLWVPLFILLLLSAVIFSFAPWGEAGAAFLAILIFFAVADGLFLLVLGLFIWDLIQIVKGNFRVIRAPLIKLVEYDDDNIFDHKEGSRLEFGRRYGYFRLPFLPLYQWSAYYKTTARELIDRACNGDEFYLIKRGRWFIYMVYPTRCFLWQGEEHQK